MKKNVFLLSKLAHKNLAKNHRFYDDWLFLHLPMCDFCCFLQAGDDFRCQHFWTDEIHNYWRAEQAPAISCERTVAVWRYLPSRLTEEKSYLGASGEKSYLFWWEVLSLRLLAWSVVLHHLVSLGSFLSLALKWRLWSSRHLIIIMILVAFLFVQLFFLLHHHKRPDLTRSEQTTKINSCRKTTLRKAWRLGILGFEKLACFSVVMWSCHSCISCE